MYYVISKAIFFTILFILIFSLILLSNSFFYKKKVNSEGRFRSSDLWVMSPTRYRCATSLSQYMSFTHTLTDDTAPVA